MNNLNKKKMGKEEREARSFQKRMKLWKSVQWDVADDRNNSKFWHQCYNNLYYLLDELNKKEMFYIYKGLPWIKFSEDTYHTMTSKDMMTAVLTALDFHSNGMCPDFDMGDIRTRLFLTINQ